MTRFIWTAEADEKFDDLKMELAHAPALQTADYELPFHLDTDVGMQTANACRYQISGKERSILAYYSISLDLIEAKSSPCTRYVATLANIVQKSDSVVKKHPLIIHTDHAIQLFIESHAFSITPGRVRKVTSTLMQPHITIQPSRVNMTEYMTGLTGLTTVDQPTIHDCEALTQVADRLHPDLQKQPLTHAINLYIDGSCHRDAENLKAGYAVVMEGPDGNFVTIKQGSVYPPSAQRAELTALCETFRGQHGQAVNICTDSSYSYFVVHRFGCMANNGFKTASGALPRHHDLVAQLAELIHYPSKIAVLKVAAHVNNATTQAAGDNAADLEAIKAAGLQLQGGVLTRNLEITHCISSDEDLQDLRPKTIAEWALEQAHASDKEKEHWTREGAQYVEKQGTPIWEGPKGEMVVSEATASWLIDEAHGPSHNGTDKMMHRLKNYWRPDLKKWIKEKTEKCETCKEYNSRPGMTHSGGQGTYPLPQGPGKEIIIDFTDMGERIGGKRYLLVMIDAYSKWAEAYPTGKESIITYHSTAFQKESDHTTDLTSRFNTYKRLKRCGD